MKYTYIGICLSIIFWTTMTFVFQKKIQPLEKPISQVNFDKNSSKYFAHSENIKITRKEFTELQSLADITEIHGLVILLSGLAIGMLFLHPIEKLRIRNSFYWSLTFSILSLIMASIYYQYTIEKFESLIFYQRFNYTSNFLVFSMIPLMLIMFHPMRLVFLKITKQEPRFVGKSELFRDPINWLFTISLLALALIIEILINPFKLINELINYFV